MFTINIHKVVTADTYIVYNKIKYYKKLILINVSDLQLKLFYFLKNVLGKRWILELDLHPQLDTVLVIEIGITFLC